MRFFLLLLGFPISLAVGFLHFEGSVVYAGSFSAPNGRRLGWQTAGIGVSSFGDSKGASYSYLTKNGLVSLRYVYNDSELDSTFCNSITASLQESFWDAGILFGKLAKTSFGLASLSGGIGFVGGNRIVNEGRRSYDLNAVLLPMRVEEERLLTVGIPFEGQIVWTPFPKIGVGVYGFANLNMEKSFAGALFGVQIGELK